MKIKQATLIFILCTLFSGYSHASFVGVELDNDTVSIGDKVTATINIDFSVFDAESLGGTFQLSYDNSILINPDFNFVADVLLTDFGIQRDVSSFNYNNAGRVNITFGTFDFSKGVTGKGVLGYLSFDSIAEGEVDLSLIDYQGGFYSFISSQQQDIQYQAASVSVVTAVPIPAAIWLLSSSLGLLVIRRRING